MTAATCSIDRVTRRWIRNVSDEKAARNGCKFDTKRGEFVIEWAERYLRLYEGAEYAGQPLIAHDWQIEATMRLFGWVKQSERWKRKVRRFRYATILVPKKNAKTPTLAWWALYLTIADGEMGQKVYLAAKDGAQSRELAGKHVLEMFRQCPEELRAECTINQTLMQLTHEPTRSILKPISSGDAAVQKAKEGLNGCVMVDEFHVVDREFMNRVSRAGISRSEPLQVQVSTAGNDPESYGHEQYERGKLIESGEIEDEQTLFICYEAPRELSDSDLAGDPLKYGKLANPAWNHLIDPVEFQADYERSKNSLTALADFKMYRLNIWQQSARPWLDMGHWAACRSDHTAASLAGRDCVAALDMAKVRDTCALVLTFWEQDGERTIYRQLPYFWVPRGRADKLRDKVHYLQWGTEGHIALIDGDTIDVNQIRLKIIELRQQFNITKFAYDDWYADELVQRLIDEDHVFAPIMGDADVDEVVNFIQGMKSFAGPTDQYEGLVIEHALLHDGNKVMTWQAGNARVRTDENNNRRPVKQKSGDYRTIDGVVAGIMSLALALERKEQEAGIMWL